MSFKIIFEMIVWKGPMKSIRYTLVALALATMLVSIFISTTFSATARAAGTVPSTLPILAKRISSKNPNGKVRSSECLIFPDGVTIDSSVDGLEFSTERSGKVSSSIITRINESASARTSSIQRSTGATSYSFLAFRTSAAGIQESVVLASFDGTTGVEVSNPAPAAQVLKEVANSLCN